MKHPPFKVMKTTVAALQATIFLIVGTLKADALTKEQAQLVYGVIMARDMTAAMLKNNPTARNMLILCGAWYRFAGQMQALIPADQTKLAESFRQVLDEAQWVKEFDKPAPVTEVQS